MSPDHSVKCASRSWQRLEIGRRLRQKGKSSFATYRHVKEISRRAYPLDKMIPLHYQLPSPEKQTTDLFFVCKHSSAYSKMWKKMHHRKQRQFNWYVLISLRQECEAQVQ